MTVTREQTGGGVERCVWVCEAPPPPPGAPSRVASSGPPVHARSTRGRFIKNKPKQKKPRSSRTSGRVERWTRSPFFLSLLTSLLTDLSSYNTLPRAASNKHTVDAARKEHPRTHTHTHRRGKLDRKQRLPPPAAAPSVSGAPRCQQVSFRRTSQQEEDGWRLGSHAHLLLLLLPHAAKLVLESAERRDAAEQSRAGQGRAGVFCRLVDTPLVADGVSAAASPPPLSESSVATSPAGGSSTWAPAFSLLLPPSPSSFRLPPFPSAH